ncbi:B12-binding domain-containing radical SAM protein [Wukongibacter sp. M2B1]|uniref:B12-binding domain-containing radical SAM protein n=1 Tax=Wukongibacter sp. M2B1 TaxID=3088895 RepID=UPI003D79F539
MKKILFYYPKIVENEDSSSLYRGLPFSVMALAAQFNPTEYEIKIVDGRLEDKNTFSIWKWFDDDVVCVGISTMTSYQIKDGLEFARLVRDSNSKVPILWGGWHPSLMPDQTIKDDLVDIVCIGQGEITLPRLVESISSNLSLEDVPNLVYKRKNGEIVHTKIEPLKVFSHTKPIERAYSYVDMESYIQPLWGNKRVIGYESSRGCPWSCSFCSIGSVYKGRWSSLGARNVADSVELLKNRYEVDAIHFFDNNFFVNRDRVLEFSSQIRERELNIHWDGTSVVEQFIKFPNDYIEELKKSGFFRVIVGVESGDEEVLKRIKKRHNPAQVLELVEKCKQNNIMASLSFMVGFPWNPEKDFYETIGLIEKIKKIDPNTEILLFIFSPYLGTQLFGTAVEYGMEFPKSLEGWANYTYDKLNVPWISQKLFHKIDRYISFFGTKKMTSSVTEFLKGSNKI